ncbi:sigma-70 family RNA polymerase sigma factor [Crossiella sp. SN42]|uniref:RNA polymerase sigma factor n=1 Tax=Crossiella sp. SN42 TaxID=2944808 RepID=UPI00207C3F3A|nr:sigma-70 family RNA polymerase sigma factor [Crossiella sp. SN42]MCO1576446.1 sigma-70 family RNA polymerase sigma factor [Crossiella sp. SN42]
MTSPEERFTALYQRHYEDIARYVRRRAPDVECRDAVAEVFLIGWRRFAEVERARKPLPWLYGVARRVLANEFRSAGRARSLLDRIARHTGPAETPNHAEETAVRVSVAAWFDRLPEPDREALRLIAWECLSTTDAALALGCSPAALAMRLHRLRRRLRREMVVTAPRSRAKELVDLSTPLFRTGGE